MSVCAGTNAGGTPRYLWRDARFKIGGEDSGGDCDVEADFACGGGTAGVAVYDWDVDWAGAEDVGGEDFGGGEDGG